MEFAAGASRTLLSELMPILNLRLPRLLYAITPLPLGQNELHPPKIAAISCQGEAVSLFTN